MPMLKQLDIVQLTDEKKVTYVSGPSGRPACPKGEWSVVGFINDEVVLAKQNTIIIQHRRRGFEQHA